MKLRAKRSSQLVARAFAAVAAVAIVLPAVQARAADDLAFETDVNAAIDAGLQYLRNVGAYTNAGLGPSRGIALLALLEKRESADPGAAVLGYANSSPGDQALARSAIQLILQDGSYGAARASFYAYSHGQSMMALSLYATTGGPEVANTFGYTLRSAIDKLVDQTLAAQGTAANGPAVQGTWGYTGPGTDSSTTQYAIAGLAAAKAFYSTQGDPGTRIPLIDAATAAAADNYERNQNADGGEGYQVVNYPSSYQQTASATWVKLLGGKDLNDATVQGSLGWLQQNYNYQTIYAAYNSWTASYYYYLWSSSKAYTLIAQNGVSPSAGNIGVEDVGTLPNAPISLDRADYRLAHRDYTTDPDARVGGSPGKYAHYLDDSQKPLWYYDYAYTLMTQQNQANGQFTAVGLRNNGLNAISHGCWNTYVCQSYALLVLERSLGGVCLDSDEDGICNAEVGNQPADNCPDTPNGPLGGTCLAGDPAAIGTFCVTDDACGAGGFCDLSVQENGIYVQLDSNGDGVGDACTCTVAIDNPYGDPQTGTASGSPQSQSTGIYDVELVNPFNVDLSVDPFAPGDAMVDFSATRPNGLALGVGLVVATDGAGRTCDAKLQLGGFGPNGEILRVSGRNLRLPLTRPSPDTTGARCVETDPSAPDFDSIPFTPFVDDVADVDVLLSEGAGLKSVCCQFINDQDALSDAFCQDVELAPSCDVDQDGDVDSDDVNAIFADRGQVASGPDDPRDANGDGLITVNDSRACALECTYPECATAPPGSPASTNTCGLLGIEVLFAMALPSVRRRLRRRA